MGLYSRSKCLQKLERARMPKAGKTKAKKKSWTKVKVKDKLNNEVFLDEKRWAKMQTEIPKILCITRGVLCDKYKVSGSLARAMIKDLAAAGTIKRVGDACSSFDLYSGVQAKSALEKAAEEAAQAALKTKK